jgi:hypothetical protein
MRQTGFYKLSPDFIELVKRLGGTYRDSKERPVYCCIQDRDCRNIYWAVPTSDISHRSPEQLERIKRYCALPDRDMRSCYYHLGHTNRPAIFKISNVLPVTEAYIHGEYTSQGIHLILRDAKLIAGIERKLLRILFDESRNPDKYEQHITSVYNFLTENTLNRVADDIDVALPEGERPSTLAQIRAAKKEPRERHESKEAKHKNDPER